MTELRERIDAANREAVGRMVESVPVWRDVQRAGDVIPGMQRNLILHAGPPIAWERMGGPQRNAVCGAAVYERLADSLEEARQLIGAGKIVLSPCHDHQTVGSMCGATSWSMPVLVVHNKTFGNDAFCHLYEHPDREKLSYGAYNERVYAHLKWLEEGLAPVLQAAIKMAGEFDVRSIIARALAMGDECHSRNFATTALFVTELGQYLVECHAGSQEVAHAFDFIRRSTQFALHLVMAACKATADAASGVEYSTIVTAIARNGVETGIRISGLGSAWFTGPAGAIEGLYFSGFGPEDGESDLGDSAITETVGLGAFAHRAAPALAMAKDGHGGDVMHFTDEMRGITVAENPNYVIPSLPPRGTPIGIDFRLVLQSGVTPRINTAMADRRGRGQIGVGNTRAPMDAFAAGLRAFVIRYGEPARPRGSPV